MTVFYKAYEALNENDLNNNFQLILATCSFLRDTDVAKSLDPLSTYIIFIQNNLTK